MEEEKLSRAEFKEAYPDATITAWIKYWLTRTLPEEPEEEVE